MSFRVTNRATGSLFEVDEGETVLAAARRQGVNLKYSCLTGHCVACRAPVVTGEVHYPKLPPVGLDPGDGEAGLALLCQAVPRTDLTIVAREIEALKDIECRRLTVMVNSVEFPVDDVALIRLGMPDGPLAYLAGQHLDVVLADGRTRSFSIANPPLGTDELELHVRHVTGGGFTDYVFDTMQPGDSLQIDAPLGTFFLRDRSPRPMICVAGGTGFSPIKAIIEEAIHLGDERPLRFYWGANTEAELYLADRARDWAERFEHIAFIPVLSGREIPETWTGRTGFVHQAVLADHNDLSLFDVYMSGPPPLIDAARRDFLGHGLPEHHLYYDSFEFAADIAAKMEA